MSIQSQINRLQHNVSAAFTAVGNKGGTVPDAKNSGNLAEAIHSIPEGVELNFEVVGGDTAPSDPKENTIWVNTSEPITATIFTATKSVAGYEGRLWISISDTSPVGFDATTEPMVSVYPLTAKQYVGGAWVTKTAKSWIGGKWVDWITYIYNKGETDYSLVSVGMRPNSSYTSPTKAPSYSMKDSSFSISESGSSSSGACGICYFNEKIDLTNATTLYVEGDFVPPNESYKSYPIVAVWSSFGTYAADNREAGVSPCYSTAEETTKIVTVDVSNCGKSWVGFIFYAPTNTTASVKIRRIYYN